MTTLTWKAVITLSNGFRQEVLIQADNQSNARAILEAQYGKGSILSGPWSIRTR